ncbi:MAG TPA: hypothetical protein VK763_03350 [Terriglobales bacterium]|nr:hypothetical protein [Terriglobales bacterium]
MKGFANAVHRKSIAVLLLPLFIATGWAQNGDPLVGTWNLKGKQDGTVITIAVMTFNAEGTTVEFDTAGTNSSASPGESIDLGVWKKTGSQTYSFKEENAIYDSSGNLSEQAVGVCKLSMAADQKSFKGGCILNFYSCSLAQCPGPLVAGPVVYEIAAKRF